MRWLCACLLFAACKSEDARRVISTTTVGVSTGIDGDGSISKGARSYDMDEGTRLMVSISPLVYLDPPRHVILDNPVPASEPILMRAPKVEAAAQGDVDSGLAPVLPGPPKTSSPGGHGSLLPVAVAAIVLILLLAFAAYAGSDWLGKKWLAAKLVRWKRRK